MLFYGNYENGKRYICAYDEEKHGTPRVQNRTGSNDGQLGKI